MARLDFVADDGESHVSPPDIYAQCPICEVFLDPELCCSGGCGAKFDSLESLADTWTHAAQTALNQATVRFMDVLGQQGLALRHHREVVPLPVGHGRLHRMTNSTTRSDPA